MSALDPVAFDIETSGLTTDAVVTVVGISHHLTNWLILNTTGRPANTTHLTNTLNQHTTIPTDLTTVPDEPTLLTELSHFITTRIDDDTHYLTAYNGETWNGGFDLPFLRSAYLTNDLHWPFDDIAYADTMPLIDYFHTNDHADLATVYDTLIDEPTCDPFDDSSTAATAHTNANWLPLLQHNLADIQRTRELAEHAGKYVPKSNFNMKNLTPPTTTHTNTH